MRALILTTVICIFSYKALAKCPLGDLFYSKGRDIDAFTYYRSCADEGDIKSQYIVGSLYYLGKGTLKNFYNTAEYYKMAAESGFAPAQVKLALLYWRGEGVQKDIVTALKWLILAQDPKDRKWFYPAMIEGLSLENEDAKAASYMKQVQGMLSSTQKQMAIKQASEYKFFHLKNKAKKLLSENEYNRFIEGINKNINDKKKIDQMIQDLYKVSITKKNT